MKFTPKDSGSAFAKAELLCAFATEEKAAELPPGVRLADGVAKGFGGELRKLRHCDPRSGPAARVLLVGLGKRADVDVEAVRRAVAVAVKEAESVEAGSVAFWCGKEMERAVGDAEMLGTAVAEGVLMGSYAYHEQKSSATPPKLKRATAYGRGAAFRSGARRGVTLAQANLFTRDLQNAPGNKMRPRDMAAAARKLARSSDRLSCRVLDEKAMEKLGMGSLLSVSRGSGEPAYLIHLTYKPKGRSKGKICFVGKGLTFDAGGISLKPAAKMEDMKFDMSGGAAVLGAFRGLAELSVPYEVHGLVPTSENLPDGIANKPGDVVTAMDGTTIEVLNTDAEGRLILCDALAYAVKKLKPDTIIDLATLTGAVVVALGHELSGMFATSRQLEADLTTAGKVVGEEVWPLPLTDHHKEQMKGRVADLRNINTPGQGNGSSAGAAFLSHFVGDTEWCHLDIAGAAWGGRARDWVGGPDGSGVGARLLLQYLETRKS